MSAIGAARSRRFLLAGLAFFVVTHVIALATMALVLRPGMDPSAFAPAQRMAFVAAHPLAWRLGWLPWQASALGDLWVCIALWAWAASTGARAAIPWAIAALALDVVSVIPEQWAEAMLVTSFVTDASRADVATWSRDWALYAEITGVWANGGYTLMTACWMIAARRSLGRSLGRGVLPAPLEIALCVLFLIAGALTWMATHASTEEAIGTWFLAAGAINGVAFPTLTVWAIVFGIRARRTAPY